MPFSRARGISSYRICFGDWVWVCQTRASSVVDPVLTWWFRSTTSVRHHNGTFENVARADASPEYLALMQGLMTSPVGRMNAGSYRPSGVSEEDLTTVPMLL